MVQAFARVAICAMIVLTAGAALTTRASAVTLSYDYPQHWGYLLISMHYFCSNDHKRHRSCV
jgi:hypothetical protein